MREDHMLFTSDSAGVYAPQEFITTIRLECIVPYNGMGEDVHTLKNGPDDEWYWTAWDQFMSNAQVKNIETGTMYNIYQSGDIWLIPIDWTEEDYNAIFE